MARSVVFNLLANPRDFERGFDRAHKKASGFQRSMGGVGRALAGTFAFSAVVAGVKTLTDAAKESQLIAAQTTAVIKSTGGAAGVSAKGFADLASAISRKVAVDDEVIQSGENILATFTNIKNSGPDKVFDQATTAAVDMAAALNGGEVTAEGLKGANLKLGKALNDPIKGISSLTRVGIKFTDAQKDQIAAMVEAGDTAGAQKLILDELEKKFGGSAEAAATSGKKLSVAWGNAQEVLGNLLLPVIEKGQELLISFIGIVDRNREAFAILGGVIVGVTGFIVAMNVATKISAAIQTAVKGATLAWAAAQKVLNFVLAANPIGLVVAAIALLAAGLIYAYKHSETFRKIVDGAFDAVAASGKFMWERVLKPTFVFLVRAWLTVADAIVKGAVLAFGWVPGIGPKLKGAAEKFQGFKDSVNKALGGIADEGVNVKLKSTFTPPKGFSMHSIVGAQGGMRIPGYGGGDRVPIMAEAGEAVVPKHLAATAAFRGWAASMRIPGFAAGGVVPRFFSASGMAGTQEGIDRGVAERTAAGIRRNYKLLIDALGGGTGPGGWRWQMAALRGQFPGLPLISGFRPGAITATGNRSYHGFGRAVDIPPIMGVFNWIAATYGKRTKELIFSPAGARQIHNGSPHMYSGITRANHWSHVHWAYDKGGWLPPGLSLAYNGTGRPERVVPPGRGRGGDIVVNLNGDVYGDRQALVATIRAGIRDAQRRGGVPAGQQLR